MKMTQILVTLTAVLFVGSIAAHAADKRTPKSANCELRLVSNAGAGEAFMSIFTRSEEECLAKSDTSVEAKFRTARGLAAKRGGAGPQQ
jgi:hypothetical protein